MAATPSDFARILHVEGGFNLRDMGGYPTQGGRRVKTGMLYRSGQMSKLSDAGAAQMAALGIRSVGDLRRGSEREAHPTRWHVGSDTQYWTRDYEAVSGVLSEVVRSTDPTAEALHAAMIGLYREIPHDHAQSFRHIFDRLAEGHVPLLFNCAAGKDRTGVLGALILEVLGVSRDLIVEDYLLTNAADFSALFDSAARGLPLPEHVRAPLTAADADYLAAMYDELDTHFGGVDAYLEQALGVDVAKRAKLRDVLLD